MLTVWSHWYFTFTTMPPIPNLKIHLFLEAPYNVCLLYFGYVYKINVVVNASGWQVSARLNFCCKWSKSVWISVYFWSELGLNFANISLNTVVATVVKLSWGWDWDWFGVEVELRLRLSADWVKVTLRLSWSRARDWA